MKKYQIKTFILFLMIAGLFWSCSKDKFSNPDSVLLTKMNSGGEDVFFKYDGNKLLESYTEEYGTVMVFTYTGDKITKLEIVDESRIYNYSDNKPIKVQTFLKGKLVHTSEYSYNTDGTVDVKYSNPQEDGSIYVTWEKEYYDAHGNRVKREDLRYDPPTTYSYVYDSKNNPYKNITGYNLIARIGKNNLISETVHSHSGFISTTTHEYQYNEMDYPISCTTTRNNKTTIEFYYYNVDE